MTPPLILLLACAGGDYTSENAAAGVQPPPGERPAEPFAPPTVAAEEAAALDPLAATDLEELGRHVGEVRAVRGVCADVYIPSSGSVVVLNFAENYRDAVTVPVFADHFGKWPGGPAAIARAYEGKTLSVQGLVTEYRGAAQIKAAHPGQIRVVE